MIEKYNFLQAKYVDKFQCNGNKCNARCCKGWKINVDDETLKRYAQVESAKELTSKIFREDNFNVVNLDEQKFCPFLTKENLCCIQKNYGEEFLSVTCRTYPRINRFINGLFEQTLTLSCPVAAELSLTSSNSMEFEIVQKNFDSEKNALNVPNLPPEVLPHFLDIQLAALAILKNKSFTIDQRLAVLGFFIERADELINLNKVDELPQLLKVYKSKNFLTETMPTVFKNFHFQQNEFVKLMFGGVRENLFDDYKKFNVKQFKEFLKADSIKLRGNFIKKFEQVFENYLVNEFFMNLYPYRLEKSVVQNFGVYLATYKIIEMFALYVAENVPTFYESDLASFICKFSTPIEHNLDYSKLILKELESKQNMFELMKIFLQP